MSNFKNIEALGLSVQTVEWDLQFGDSYPGGINIPSERKKTKSHTVKAEDLESLLSQGVRVTGNNIGTSSARWETGVDGTHTGLLIGVRPIEKPDSLERLVRDWLDATARWGEGPHNAFRERARKLLE